MGYMDFNSTITFTVEMPAEVTGQGNPYSGRVLMTISGSDLAINAIQDIAGDFTGPQDAYFTMLLPISRMEFVCS